MRRCSPPQPQHPSVKPQAEGGSCCWADHSPRRPIQSSTRHTSTHNNGAPSTSPSPSLASRVSHEWCRVRSKTLERLTPPLFTRRAAEYHHAQGEPIDASYYAKLLLSPSLFLSIITAAVATGSSRVLRTLSTPVFTIAAELSFASPDAVFLVALNYDSLTYAPRLKQYASVPLVPLDEYTIAITLSLSPTLSTPFGLGQLTCCFAWLTPRIRPWSDNRPLPTSLQRHQRFIFQRQHCKSL